MTRPDRKAETSEAVRERVARRRRRLAEDGLKEASSIIVPVHLEERLRALAKRWTAKHLAERAGCRKDGLRKEV